MFLAFSKFFSSTAPSVYSAIMSCKTVTKVVESRWQSEGRGARVRRSIGRKELRNLDPFLMLDEFQVGFMNRHLTRWVQEEF